LTTFDIVDGPSLSVALSAILTGIARAAMSAAPMHAFTAPVAGSGKSKLVNIAAILATGHHAPVIQVDPKPEEFEKRLASSLLSGDQIASIDNVEAPLGGVLLNQILTETIVNIRIFNTQNNHRVSNRILLFATGNNLMLRGDIGRRSLLCRLDPQCERPELRHFETPDPCSFVLTDRPALVVDVLTVLRAFFLAGMPDQATPLGSFGEWSRWVRDPLIWLGEADPVDTMEHVRREDPRLSALSSVLEQWETAIGSAPEAKPHSTLQVVSIANTMPGFPEFREALLSVAGERGAISVARLGNWLGRVKDREVAGRRFCKTVVDGTSRWQLCKR
jgi:putative DNA primase/helicase